MRGEACSRGCSTPSPTQLQEAPPLRWPLAPPPYRPRPSSEVQGQEPSQAYKVAARTCGCLALVGSMTRRAEGTQFHGQTTNPVPKSFSEESGAKAKAGFPVARWQVEEPLD